MSTGFDMNLSKSWTWSPLKFATTYLNRGSAPDYVDDGRVLAISQASNQAAGLDWERARFHDYSGDPRKLKGYLLPNDVLINSTGNGTLGRVGYFAASPGNVPCMADGHVTVARAESQVSDPRYLYYWLSSTPFQDYIYSALVVGATNQIELNRERLAGAPVALPPLDEQRRIADFLDIETGKIDRILEARRLQMVVLESREPSLLDAAYRARESGEIRLKHLVSLITSGPRGWGDLIADKGTPFIRIMNIPRRGVRLESSNMARIAAPGGYERERTRTKSGDVLVSITADIGSVAIVDSSTVGGNVSQHIALARPTRSLCDSEWLAYAIKSPAANRQLASKSYGGTKVGLGLGDIAELRLPRLDLATQQSLVHHINDAMSKSEVAREAIVNQISLLAERRQALITAAVAGQIDVTTARGLALSGGGAA